MRVAIPLNIQLNRPYKQRPTSKKKRSQRPAAQQQRWSLGSILKFARNIVKSPLVEKLGRAALNELLNLYSKSTRKIKNKKLKRILQSNVVNSSVNMGVEYGQMKLG